MSCMVKMVIASDITDIRDKAIKLVYIRSIVVLSWSSLPSEPFGVTWT